MRPIIRGALGVWFVAVFLAGAAGQVTTGPMAELPLVLIPAYFVPLFIMLHLASLLQARQKASTRYFGEPV